MATPRTTASRDNNRHVVLTGVASSTVTVDGVSYVAGVTPVPIAVNPSTNKVKVIITIV